VRMAHQSLNGFQVVPIIQKRRGKGMPHHVRMNSFLNQNLSCSLPPLSFGK
jgi:hypothetical protein